MVWTFDAQTLGVVTTAVVHGPLQASEFVDLEQQVRREMLLQRGLGLALDLRDAILQISTLDLFGIASTVSEIFGRETPLAILIAPATMSATDARFFENVICNRGGLAGFFTDLATAHDWLKSCITADREA